jgi:hypothetical protein
MIRLPAAAELVTGRELGKEVLIVIPLWRGVSRQFLDGSRGGGNSSSKGWPTMLRLGERLLLVRSRRGRMSRPGDAGEHGDQIFV